MKLVSLEEGTSLLGETAPWCSRKRSEDENAKKKVKRILELPKEGGHSIGEETYLSRLIKRKISQGRIKERREGPLATGKKGFGLTEKGG